MAKELAPLLRAQMPDVPATLLDSYPSPRDLIPQLSGAASLLVLLDVFTDPDQAMPLLGEIARMGGGVQVLALLAGDNPDFILRCLRAGAADFLLQPFTAEQLEAALTKLSRLQAGADAASSHSSKVVVVMPAKGACGATTVATNLALFWKNLGAKRVLLADLDPLTGTISFLLKIKSLHSFLDILQRSHELDEDLWDATVTEAQGIDVLLAPEMVTDAQIELTDPSPILQYARHAYDVVVIDAGSAYGDWNLQMARVANEVLLVTTNELPALQAAQRALSYLESSRIARWKVRLLVNRYQREIGLSQDVIGTALHTEVFEALPSDYDAVQRALMEGKAVATGSSIGKSIKKLAERLGGPMEKDAVKKSSGLGSLFGLFSKSTK